MREWWRPAAPGYAALAITTMRERWRPAAPGFAALAITTNPPTGPRSLIAAGYQL